MPAKKKPIPATVRNAVWNKYMGRANKEGECMCCGFQSISTATHHCGHIVSEHNGGKATIQNLRPICQICNGSIGTQNMVEFMVKAEFEFPENWNGYKDEKVAQEMPDPNATDKPNTNRPKNPSKILVKGTKPKKRLPKDLPPRVDPDAYLTKTYPVTYQCRICQHNPRDGHRVTNHHQDLEIIVSVQNTLKAIITNKELVLCAQSQSGKSDFIKRILDLFNNNKETFASTFKIESCFVVISASDTALKTDQQSEFHNFLPKRRILHLNDLMRLVDKFGPNGKKKRKGRKAPAEDDDDENLLLEMKNNCLILVDEGHGDLATRSTIDKFRQLLGCTFNNHTNETVKLINISATPYEQVKAGLPIIILLPRAFYYGIIEMYDNGKLFSAFDLTTLDGMRAWRDHLFYTLNVDTFPLGYYIVRVNDSVEQKKVEKHLKKIFDDGDHDIVPYNMDSDCDLNGSYLNRRPNRPTFIMIMNKLRKGNRIIKDHIIAVHDKPKNSYTSATYQGLLGRMTGYNANRESLIYCDLKKAMEHMDWILNDYSVDRLPEHSQWIKKDNTLNSKCLLASSKEGESEADNGEE